jgi:hypothetical protein
MLSHSSWLHICCSLTYHFVGLSHRKASTHGPDEKRVRTDTLWTGIKSNLRNSLNTPWKQEDDASSSHRSLLSPRFSFMILAQRPPTDLSNSIGYGQSQLNSTPLSRRHSDKLLQRQKLILGSRVIYADGFIASQTTFFSGKPVLSHDEHLLKPL